MAGSDCDCLCKPVRATFSTDRAFLLSNLTSGVGLGRRSWAVSRFQFVDPLDREEQHPAMMRKFSATVEETRRAEHGLVLAYYAPAATLEKRAK